MTDRSAIESKPRLAAVSRRNFLLGASALATASWNTDVRAQAAKPTKPPSAPKGQVVVGYSQEVTVLHPLMPANEVDQGVWWNLFSPLWIQAV